MGAASVWLCGFIQVLLGLFTVPFRFGDHPCGMRHRLEDLWS